MCSSLTRRIKVRDTSAFILNLAFGRSPLRQVSILTRHLIGRIFFSLSFSVITIDKEKDSHFLLVLHFMYLGHWGI